MNYKKFVITGMALLWTVSLFAQGWNPNVDEDTYKNPVIFADYSDPDVIRDGDDFYMVASSFNCMPGLPVLHSKDLVNDQFKTIDDDFRFKAVKGRWIGAKAGVFSINPYIRESEGFAQFDWFRVE